MITKSLTRFLLCASMVLPFSHFVSAQTSTAAGEGYVDVGGDVKIHYIDKGPPNARTTILFVPGWCMTTEVWRDQIASFSVTSRVVSIDPRSQGLSTVTTKSNTPEQRAQDLRAVIQALKLDHVFLVGWSQGVQDVAAYAAAFRGLEIAGYVLVDAPVGAGPDAAVANAEGLKQLLGRLAIYEQYPAQYLRGMMNAIITSAEGRKRIDELVSAGLRTPPDLGISMLMMDFVSIDRRPALAKFNRPTLVIAAAQSGEIATQREMAKTIKDARFETIEDAGHAVFLDQPKKFQSLLAGFIASVAV